MDLINGYIVVFILGALFSAIISVILFSKLKNTLSKDFAQIANAAIKNEQEDLRKQNREALEEKILPLTNQLNQFKDKVEKFNISGVENTTKIIEQIAVLEKNNKTLEREARELASGILPALKRKRGRPSGSKDKMPRKRRTKAEMEQLRKGQN